MFPGDIFLKKRWLGLEFSSQTVRLRGLAMRIATVQYIVGRRNKIFYAIVISRKRSSLNDISGDQLENT
jgi:hypothetical protein